MPRDSTERNSSLVSSNRNMQDGEIDGLADNSISIIQPPSAIRLRKVESKKKLPAKRIKKISRNTGSIKSMISLKRDKSRNMDIATMTMLRSPRRAPSTNRLKQPSGIMHYRHN